MRHQRNICSDSVGQMTQIMKMMKGPFADSACKYDQLIQIYIAHYQCTNNTAWTLENLIAEMLVQLNLIDLYLSSFYGG